MQADAPKASWSARLTTLLASDFPRSFAAQILMSAFHFGLNMVLLRIVSPYEYGVFAFAWVLAMFALAINNALVSTPLSIYTPIIPDAAERATQKAMLASANLVLSAAFLAGGISYALLAGFSLQISTGLAAFVAAYAARHYSRTIGFAQARALVVACGDVVYVLTGTILVGMLYLSDPTLAVGPVLMALTAANLIAMLAERRILDSRSKPDESGRRPQRYLGSLRGYPPVWRRIRWALVGALTSMFLGQAHSFIVTSSLGPEAFAPLAAGFVLFGPVRVALIQWQNMAKPVIAMNLDARRYDEVRNKIRTTNLLAAMAVLFLAVVLYLLWPWIHELMFARRYADAPMGRIVTIWCLITLAATSYNAPSAALQALSEFRLLALASVWGAFMSATLVWTLLATVSTDATLWGVLASEIFMAVLLAWCLSRALDAVDDTRSSVAAP